MSPRQLDLSVRGDTGRACRLAFTRIPRRGPDAALYALGGGGLWGHRR